MKKIEVRKNGSKRVYTENTQPSLTDQSYKEDCDTNTIIKKFLKTGQVTHVAKMAGQFADVSAVPDFHTAMSRVKEAEYAFMQLPSQLRAKHGNDVSKMIDWINDPKNKDEAVELGLREWVEAPPKPQAVKKEEVTVDKKDIGDNKASN